MSRGSSQQALSSLGSCSKTACFTLRLERQYVTDLLLKAHLSLSLCQSAQGNKYSIYQLVRATYLSYLLWQAGVGVADRKQFCEAEEVLEQLSGDAHVMSTWKLDGTDARAMSGVLGILDRQLATVRSSTFLECHARLERLLCVEIASSFESGR